MLQALGLPELQAKWPQEVLPLGAKVGGLTPQAAAHLGLEAGTLVAQGGADAFIGLIGLGVVEPGQLGILTGECTHEWGGGEGQDAGCAAPCWRVFRAGWFGGGLQKQQQKQKQRCVAGGRGCCRHKLRCAH